MREKRDVERDRGGRSQERPFIQSEGCPRKIVLVLLLVLVHVPGVRPRRGFLNKDEYKYEDVIDSSLVVR